MLELIPFAEPNIVGLKMDGKIDSESYDRAMAAIRATMDANETVNIYAEVVSVGGMSAEVFFENFKVKFQLLRELDKFGKEAVVSDKAWIERAVKIGDKLFSSVEVRYFAMEEKSQALDWIGGHIAAKDD